MSTATAATTASLPEHDHSTVGKGPVSLPENLDQLVSGLRDYLGTGGLTSAGVDVSYIVQLMNGYNSNPVEWQRFALFDKYRYTRNLVDAGVEGAEYNLIVLCWGPGHQSAIHDHANSHCVMKVLSGNLTETRYAWPNPNEATPSEVSDEDAKSMEVMQKMTLGKDEVTYIHDRIGLHRVSNASDSEPAVSLHLYSPPIRICKMFNERTGAARAVSCQVFFSKDGVRISTLPDGCKPESVTDSQETPDSATARSPPMSASATGADSPATDAPTPACAVKEGKSVAVAA